jgi:hypothetical protein
MIEWLSIEHQPVSAMLEELSAMNELNLWRPEVLAALKLVSQDKFAAAFEAGDRLPVGAIAAVRKIALISPDRLTVDCLRIVANNAPVLAADLLRSVNSWAYPPSKRAIFSLKEAIIYSERNKRGRSCFPQPPESFCLTYDPQSLETLGRGFRCGTRTCWDVRR